MGWELWLEPGGGGWTGWDGQCSLEGGMSPALMVPLTHCTLCTAHVSQDISPPSLSPTPTSRAFLHTALPLPMLSAHGGHTVTLVAATVTLVAAETSALCCPAS